MERKLQADEPIEPEILDDIDMSAHEKDYSEEGFWKKLKGYAAKAGVSLVYKALQLYYVAQSPNCPKRVKMGIYSALGYFILPVDAIPDFIPITGYTDDLAAIAMALLLAQVYITDDIRARARAKVVDFFGEEQVEKAFEKRRSSRSSVSRQEKVPAAFLYATVMNERYDGKNIESSNHQTKEDGAWKRKNRG